MKNIFTLFHVSMNIQVKYFITLPKYTKKVPIFDVQ